MLPELLLATVPLLPLFNFKKRKVGGIWFFKLGRLNISFSLSKRPLINDT